MPVKKKTARRAPAKSKTAAPAGPQSAADRKAAESQLTAMISRHAPEHHKLLTTARKSLGKHLPSAYEIIYEYRSWVVISYSPSDRGYQGVLGLRADADSVKLYFTQGKTLPDPEKLLQGSANARWIQLESASTLTRPAVLRLVNEALARNPIPFAPADGGLGPVIINSTSAKK
ncbi:MAG TPA: hypothetical protein VG711_12655 [Phycisphaerales bacterium]|nr:hypothetical protein [Phycisphaerales bacterium]